MAKGKKKQENVEMPSEIMKTKTSDVIDRIKKELEKIDSKDFNVYFYVIDTKGVPSGSLLYIYKIAYELKELGYNVTMLHNENDFVGIGQWAEKKYSELNHAKTNDRGITASPSDFLIIPEIYTDIMSQTRNLPCKRVILLQNFDYMTRIIPVGVHPYEYGITDAIVNTDSNEKLVKNNLPRMSVRKIRPGISSTMFRLNEKPKKMVVNFVVKDGNDASRIVKPFFWKYPQLKWVTFAQLSNLPQEIFADALRDAAITVIVDESTSFGYSALEALKTGNIVIAKIPEHAPDWMLNENGELTDSIVWIDTLDEAADIIANLVAMWVRDDVPAELYDEIEKTAEMHTMDWMREDIKSVFVDGLFAERREEIEKTLETVLKKANEESTEISDKQ